MDKKMIIDIDDVFCTENAVIIINFPTNVFYEFQCGGMVCDHEEVEGFMIILGTDIDFDDCSYGCDNLDRDRKAREKLAFDLNVLFQKEFPDRIRFDFNRIDQLKEGYWPILYNLRVQKGPGVYDITINPPWENIWYPAVLHNGNCD